MKKTASKTMKAIGIIIILIGMGFFIGNYNVPDISQKSLFTNERDSFILRDQSFLPYGGDLDDVCYNAVSKRGTIGKSPYRYCSGAISADRIYFKNFNYYADIACNCKGTNYYIN